MKNLWCILLFHLFTFTLSAQSYEQLWKHAEEASAQDLPRQALEQVRAVYDKAIRENNDVQLLKSHLALIQYNVEISGDSILPFTRLMLQALEREKRPLQRSLWHSALAQVYEQNIGTFTSQGQTYAEVKAQAVAHYEASLAEPELLLAMSYRSFLPLFEEQPHSRFFHEDCLHVLYYAYQKSRFISVLDKKNCIERIRQVYGRYANRDAVVLLTLDALDRSRRVTDVRGDLEENPYYQTLLQLYGNNSLQPASLYVLARMVSLSGSTYARKDGSQYSMDHNNRNDSILYAWTEKALNNPLYKDEKEALSYFEHQRDLFNAPEVYIPGFQDEYYPAEVINLGILNRNVETLTFHVIPLSHDCAAYDALSPDQRRRIIRRHRAVAHKYCYKPVNNVRHWNRFMVNMNMPEKPGVYELEVLVNNQKVESRTFHVTALAPLAFTVNPGKHHLVAVDRQTGFPVQGAEVYAYDRHKKTKKLKTYLTEDGELELHGPVSGRNVNWYDRPAYYVGMPGDHGAEAWYMQGRYGYYPIDSRPARTSVDLFTDRAIYRPGQQVQFSGVVYTRQGDLIQTDSTTTATVYCLDTHQKKIDSLQVHTDGFGTFNGRFTLPQGRLNGQYMLLFQTDKQISESLRFRVEEYKRPTLQVRFMDVSERYQLNDSVTIEGIAETYTGLPVADARVAYQVVHHTWWNRGEETELQNGTIVTDARGHFRFRIRLTAATEYSWLRSYNCHFFRINCDVTAANGETVSGATVLSAETRRAYFKTDLPAVVCKEYLPECRIDLWNASGVQVGDSVRCEVRQNGRQLETYRLQAGHKFIPHILRALPSGKYQFVFHAEGGVEDLRHEITLFSALDAVIPDSQEVFFTYQHSSPQGDRVKAFIGTSADEALVYYHLVAGDSLIEKRRIPLDRHLQCLELAYRPEFGDAATAYLAMVRNNRLYTYSYTVRKPLPDQRLLLSWTSFRSRLQPGQQEEWRLRITRPDGTPARANLMACLYDASLDQLATRSWNFSSVGLNRLLPSSEWNNSNFASLHGSVLQGSLTGSKWVSEPHPRFTSWKPGLFDYYARSGYAFENKMAYATSGVRRAKAYVQLDAVAPMESESVCESEDGGLSAGAGSEIRVRSNFAETAFFQPALRTDAQGEVSLSFTLPESMTQWNFEALAHDMQMNHGSLSAQVIARKDFMVQAAMPRFVRRGDRLSLPVTVTNLSSENVSFGLTLTVENGLRDGEVLKNLTESVALAAGENKVIHFEFPVIFDTPWLVCRVIGQGEHFSDGEEHLLPVCSNQVEVTRTLPFSLRQPGVADIELPDWLRGKHVTHPVLTVEMTSDPLWYTLSALPVMAGRKDNLTADDWATVFYAAALGERIVRDNPLLAETLENRSEELDSLFMPRLERLDACTPWLTQGQNEAERVRALRSFVSSGENGRRQAQALEHLKGLQQADGGWAWCPQMKSNVWTTVDVSLLLAKVCRLTGNSGGKDMLRKAYAYLQTEMNESVAEMKRREQKYNQKQRVSEIHLQYLYLTTLLDEKLTDAGKFLLRRASELRKELTMYGKSVAAYVWAENGYDEEAALALQSLLEHTTVTPEHGRFFDTSRALSSRSSYRIPTQCATIATLQHFGRQQEAEEMLLWLLQSKRTQMWDTPRASTDAVYTLLSGSGQTALSTKAPLAYTLYQGEKSLYAESGDSSRTCHTGGYMKQTFTDAAMVKADRLQVTKQSEGLSWGAVYATGMQPEDEVEKSGSGFDLSYTLEVLDHGKWVKFRFGKFLHKGMRVRRVYQLKAERNCDFVKIRADRPACFVPLQALSGPAYFDRFSAYLMIRDQANEYYVEHLAKGTYRFAEEFFVDRSGSYAIGSSRVTCLQAPEYTALTPSIWLHVE